MLIEREFLRFLRQHSMLIEGEFLRFLTGDITFPR
jgi:hypothetical protein